MKRVMALVVLVGVLACDDPFESLIQPVPEVPTQVTLWDYREGPFHRPSAFDLADPRPVRVDQVAEWDFLFYLTGTGDAQLRPYATVVDLRSEAGLQKVSSTFDDLRRAPADGYRTDAPTSIAAGDVLAVVSRQRAGTTVRCRRFGKLEILSVDPDALTVTFRHLVNPNCEARGLVPGQRGDA